MTITAATIEYTGSLVTEQVTTSPWTCSSAIYPDRGGIPYMPQFNLEVLQPINLDGARYRVAGAHFPVFMLLTVTPVISYQEATRIARQMELCKGETVRITQMHQGTSTYEDFEDVAVIDVRAVSNAKRVLGASGNGGVGGSPVDSALLACVDTEWTLQVIPI